MIVGLEPACRHIRSGDARECLFFQAHVGVDVDLRRFDRFMTEPQRDHGLIDAMVE